jgi:hypothetical protein
MWTNKLIRTEDIYIFKLQIKETALPNVKTGPQAVALVDIFIVGNIDAKLQPG